MQEEPSPERVLRVAATDARSVRLRLWRYVPLVLWLALISLASTSALSADNTSRLFGPLLRWLFPGLSATQLLRVHFALRKCAHFTEYFVLALLTARAFIPSSLQLLSRGWFPVSLTLVAVYALLDEYHQTFVATRTGSIYDSLIDICGAVTALLLIWLWRARR